MTDVNYATPNLASPQILTRDNGDTIAYYQTKNNENPSAPGVVFCPGFMSDMTGGKAIAVEAYCQKRGVDFLRFDYQGHGQSSGAFEAGTIGRWADDTVCVIDALTQGPQIVVGSSMGGWIMMLAARQRPDRIKGLIGIAAAPDFTVDLLETQLSPAQRAEIETNGVVYVDSEYGPDPTPFTKALIEDGNQNLVLRQAFPFAGPVRLLQGMADPDVPWQTGLRLQQMLAADDVVLSLIKDGDHRLSRDEDLARLTATVGEVIDKLSDEDNR